MIKLLSLIILICSFQALAAPVAKVIFLRKPVTYIKHGKEVKLLKGQLLMENDILRTGKKGLVILGFDKDFRSRMKLSQNSELLISPRKNKSQVDLATRLYLKSGILTLRTKTLDKKLSVKTTSAAMGVRGTEFVVVEGTKQNTSMSVREGEVSFGPNDETKSIGVNAGKGIMTNENGQAIAPREFDWQKDVNWNMAQSEGSLEHPEDFFANVQKTWERYKKEQEILWNNYKQEQQDKLDQMNQDNEDLKSRMFDQFE